MLKEPMADERRRFALARALAVLGPPAPGFSQARLSLSIPGERLVRGVSRAFAERLVAVLSEHGVTPILQPAEQQVVVQPVAPPRRVSVVRIIGLVFFLVVLAGAIDGFLSSRSVETRRTMAFGLGMPSLAPPQQQQSPRWLSTQEISQRASPSTLSIRCGGKMGSGFFVEEELALTNAHVACPVGKSMAVVLPDGRQLIGETIKRDEDLDLATVRVVGAKAVPLKLGDVTRLQPGDPLVFIGSPKGMDFTVHEGKVGFVGRQYLGLGYVQFNASVNHGNSGGPLLDGHGEVVGVVSLKIENADGLGLALPIAYASKLITVPSTPEAQTRWKELLAKVARDEARDVEQFKEQNSQPVVAALREVDEVGIVALLIEHVDSPSSRERHRLVLEMGGERCLMDVDFDHWKPLKEAMDNAEDLRRMNWIASHGIIDGVYVGIGRLPVEDCSLPAVGKAFLKVDGAGDEELDRYVVPLEAITAAREAANRRKSRMEAWEQQQQQQRAEDEARSDANAAQWRLAFRYARERVSRAEAAKKRVQEAWTTGQDVHQRLAEAEEQLRLANEQLEALERDASNHSVPREWRQ